MQKNRYEKRGKIGRGRATTKKYPKGLLARPSPSRGEIGNPRKKNRTRRKT